MKIRFLGHACFQLTPEHGPRIIIDPYDAGFSARTGYHPVGASAEVVLVTHEHADHNAVGEVRGDPKLITESTTVDGMKIVVVQAFHDAEQGAKRGKDRIYVIEADGLRVCHVGDLGHVLTDEQVAAVGRVDVLMLPVGGFYTIDAAQAWQVVGELAPMLVIPMHYKVRESGLPIATVDDFIRDRRNVERPASSELEVSVESLPKERTVVVLKMLRAG
jgi:L-ascorbate metabolism protein UlaG (beta-lactamase superfamily)